MQALKDSYFLIIEKKVLENPVFNQEDRYNQTDDEQFSRAVEKLVECAKHHHHDQLDKLFLMRFTVCYYSTIIP